MSRPAVWVVMTIALISCGGETARELTAPDAVQQAALARGEAARDALAQSLLGALTSALVEGGPARGIEVCRDQAPALAARIARDHPGVRLGRTAQRRRNAVNAPPSWARSHVESASTEAKTFALDGAVGALFPIRLQPKCVLCHGPKETLDRSVLTALDRHYPSDRATGFAPGDLRGWFWLEVDLGD